MISAAFCAFAVLPVVIDTPGRYLTRAGEVVEITTAPPHVHAFNCRGAYPCGTVDRWHRCGRLLFGTESRNDIVSKA